MKRTLEDRRDFEQLSALTAIEWLNGEIPVDFSETGETRTIPEEAQRRIKRVFDLVLAVKAVPFRYPPDVNVVDELNEILARYPKVFKFEMGDFGGQFFRVPKGPWVDAHEAGAVESILNLAHGGLEKLRTCLCGRWYIAKKSDQNSCSGACRRRKYEQTPAYKAHKAAKAKANYQSRKNGFGVKRSDTAR
jgi:hypothetical protein